MGFPNVQSIGVRLGGKLVFIQVPQPAAGNSWTYTQPDGYMLELLNVSYRIVTSAVVLNRLVALNLSYQSLTFWNQADNNPITASQSIQVSFDPFVTSLSLNTSLRRIAMGAMMIPPGAILQHAVSPVDAADQLSAISITGFAWPLG